MPAAIVLRSIPIVALTTPEMRTVDVAEVRGVLAKGSPPDQLLRAIREAATGSGQESPAS